ncbi:YceI family protein [uncultured Albimonas sp.]|uniref:YceI family protein n=1 Tax=uncultured Albimonas sp. TaxID=1331701 RepID=UPI0030EB97F6
MDPAASQLSVTIDVGGRRMAGVFESWRADIAFDPAAPEACRVRVEVDVASLSFPDGMATASAAEPRWLAASEHPVAVFEGAGFHRDAPGAWTVRGDLTLKGETRPLELQVSILTQGETAEAEVSAALLRTDYAVGEPAEEMVGLAVTLEASVTARRLD